MIGCYRFSNRKNLFIETAIMTKRIAYNIMRLTSLWLTILFTLHLITRSQCPNEEAVDSSLNDMTLSIGTSFMPERPFIQNCYFTSWEKSWNDTIFCTQFIVIIFRFQNDRHYICKVNRSFYQLVVQELVTFFSIGTKLNDLLLVINILFASIFNLSQEKFREFITFLNLVHNKQITWLP